MTRDDIANDNAAFDDQGGAKGRRAAALKAAAEYRGRHDLIELAKASNAWIAELQRQVIALNRARLDSTTVAEQTLHRRQIKMVLAKCGEEGQRFDAIQAAMDEATLIRFWEQVGVPARA